MANRSQDWLRQAEADLRHAGNSMKAGDHEWSCFASQQAAEKALKALYQHLGMEAWGHTVTILIGNLPPATGVPEDLLRSGKLLDKHYLPTRYPNGFDSGAPTDFYTAEEAAAALIEAEKIVVFCRRQIRKSP